MELYEFQKKVARHLRAGHNVILQAPTGSGKTLAALWPFFETWDRGAFFPKQCIYSVPMRTLANQFTEKTRKQIKEELLLMTEPQVRIQTGERPDDPKIEGDIVFTTIDQTLSNILCVPYAVGGGSANINAGAVISSYLVFDEFHLFSPDDSMRTTLELLTLLNGITPFVLMTATFSTKMLEKLADKLNAKVVTVSHDELAKIPSQMNKVRRYKICDKTLEAEDVWQRHHTRSIAICNTVERAQNLYKALAAKARGTNTEIILLHARFTSKDRTDKEKTIRKECGGNKEEWDRPSVILVATQVIEVGLDITCENLHTEIAPANAILQRAGRCARFENEQGDVLIYDVPLDKKGNRGFAPYHRKTEKELCEKAWDAFKKRSGNALDFFGEQDVIDEVHTETDERVLQELDESKGKTWDQIRHAMTQCDPSMRSELIRDSSDGCTLLVCTEDTLEKIGNPFAYRGFSFYRGSLRGDWKNLQEWAYAKDLRWIVQIPREKPKPEQDEDSKQKIKFDWIPIPPHFESKDLPYSPIYAVNPELVAYDERIGFRFSENGDVDPEKLLERAKGHRREFNSKYQLESYPDHIKKMTSLYHERQAERLNYVAMQLEKRLELPNGSIDHVARLTIAFHDVGKMQVDWQKWARNYQAAIGKPVSDERMMIAHTYSETEEHREKEKKIRPKRPHHAAEGAAAVMNLVRVLVGENDALYKAVMTAIARHHSPRTDSLDEDYQIHTAAPNAVAQALKEAGENIELAIVASKFELNAPDINFDEERLSNDDPAEAWLIYLLIVRALRLADGESQEGNKK